MKILVIHLGGTISCDIINGVLSPVSDITGEFRRIAKEVKDVRFYHRRRKPFLSEYLDGAHLTKIGNEVEKAITGNLYDGIILTHGSDTVAYTAAALSYAVGCSSIPVVLVCSELPLSDERSSAPINLRAAVSLIRSGVAKGVFTVYKNSDAEATVFRGSRLLNYRTYESALNCAGEAYGKVVFEKAERRILGIKQISNAPVIGNFIKNTNYRESSDSLSPLKLKLRKCCPVLNLKVYPGMLYPHPPISCKAVILSSYHSGTVNTRSAEAVRFSKLCKLRKIPVFIDGIGANADYESMLAYDNLGFKRLPPLSSPVAMLIKAWLLISNGESLDKLDLPLGGDL